MVLRIAAPQSVKSKASVIFLHGLGDSGAGWSFLADACHRNASLRHVNFVFPNAPVRFFPSFGESLPGWFDLKTIGSSIKESVTDERGIFESIKSVRKLVQTEIDGGVPADKIVIGGFSQGAAVTQAMAVTCKEFKLGGFISLSGFLPVESALKLCAVSTNKNTPFFLGHGDSDDVVPIEASKQALKTLRGDFGMTDVELKVYRGLPHSASPAEFEDVQEFLQRVLN